MKTVSRKAVLACMIVLQSGFNLNSSSDQAEELSVAFQGGTGCSEKGNNTKERLDFFTIKVVSHQFTQFFNSPTVMFHRRKKPKPTVSTWFHLHVVTPL